MTFMLMPRITQSETASKQRPVIQAKLRVSAPNDRFEREADRSADQVMRMSGNGKGRAGLSSISSMSGRVASRSECPSSVQADANRGMEVRPPAEARLQTMRHGGQPLPNSVREHFEGRFGHDFSNVRVHPNARTDADAMQARAFTLGGDIAFGPGEYAPETSRGRWLLAHELTHVIQQRNSSPGSGVVQREVYTDCVEANTFEPKATKELDKALIRAKDFTDVAISNLNMDPGAKETSSAYPLALQRHFLNPNKAQRTGLRNNFIAIRDQLKPENIRCVATTADKDYCSSSEKAIMGAFMRGGQSFLCWGFWMLNRNCKAIVLVHEAAHAAGFGMKSTHPPYRGSDEYPSGGKAPKSSETTAIRTDNPDAYAFFGAHVWREIDSACGVPAEFIEITSPPPSAGTMQFLETADECAKGEALSPFCSQVMKEAVQQGWTEKR